MKIIVPWDVTPCSVTEIYLCFEGTYYLHLQVRRVSQVRNQKEVINGLTA
jgi:predicted DNA repair protein MutK